MSDESGGSNPLGSFMAQSNAKGGDKAGAGGSIFGKNKTQSALEKKEQEEQEKKDKELNEAKKESMFKAGRYNQADATKRKFQEMIILLPFVALGAIALIYLVMHGGDIIHYLFNTLFTNIISSGK